MIPILNPANLTVNGKNVGMNAIEYLIKMEVNKFNKIFFIKSGTGTGKTVSIPAELFKACGVNVVLLEPRVINTVEIARDVEKFYPMYKIGENLTFITSQSKVYAKQNSVVICTYGIFINLLVSAFDNKKPMINLERIILVVDEFHEKTLDLEILFPLIKRFVEVFTSSVIFMSATFDFPKYKRLFDVPDKHFLQVTGIQYKVHQFFSKQSIPNLNQEIVRTVKNVSPHTPGHWIIFCEGGMRMEALNTQIGKLGTFNVAKLKSKTLFKFVTQEALQMTKLQLSEPSLNMKQELEKIKPFFDYVEAGIKGGSRKLVFVTTNVAETGVSLANVNNCVDTGMVTRNIFNPRFNMNFILDVPVSKENVIQRRGRVGRKDIGFWFPMFTKKTYDAMSYEAAITNYSDITSFLLRYLELNISIYGDKVFENFDFLNVPPKITIIRTFEQLYIHGMINSYFNISIINKIISRIYSLSVEEVVSVLCCFYENVHPLDLVKFFCVSSYLAYITPHSDFYFDNRIFVEFIELFDYLELMYEQFGFTEFEKRLDKKKVRTIKDPSGIIRKYVTCMAQINTTGLNVLKNQSRAILQNRENESVKLGLCRAVSKGFITKYAIRKEDKKFYCPYLDVFLRCDSKSTEIVAFGLDTTFKCSNYINVNFFYDFDIIYRTT